MALNERLVRILLGFLLLGCVWVFSGLSNTAIVLSFSVALSWLAVFHVYRLTGNVANLLLIFTLFYVAYGIAGPLADVVGSPIADIFGNSFPTSRILVLYSLGLVGLIIGTSIPVHSEREMQRPDRIRSIVVGRVCPTDFVKLGIGLAAIASIMELVNFLRVGGAKALIFGKAFYQSEVNDLVLSLPGFNLLIVATAIFFLGLSLANAEKFKARLIPITVFVIMAGFVLMIGIVLGRRGPMLALVFAGYLAHFYFKPPKKIGAKILVGFFLAYAVLVGIHTSRAIVSYGFATGDWDPFIESLGSQERLIKAANPFVNEFGAPFGNLSVYLEADRDGYALGKTYLNSFALFIPGSIYPGEKPKQVVYDFRDRYFPTEKGRGDIGSTGFSAILESVMNFGASGVLVSMFLIGYMLMRLEQLRYSPVSEYWIFYASAAQMLQMWHRSSFGDTIAAGVVTWMLGFFSLLAMSGILFVVRSLHVKRRVSHGF